MTRLNLIQTYSPRPEQYNAIFDGFLAGYIRLMDGNISVEYPACGGELLFQTNVTGEIGEVERDHFLRLAITAIRHRIAIDRPTLNADAISVHVDR